MKNYSYITVLSNWLLGYDKYSNTYRKDLLSKSTYPNEFYLLDDSILYIGLEKAIKLLKSNSIIKNYSEMNLYRYYDRKEKWEFTKGHLGKNVHRCHLVEDWLT